MQVLFDGDAHVHYGFLWFDALGGTAYETDLTDARGGQTNGLLGAAEPGVLSMVTGMHTGLVALRVEALDGPPDDLGDWEEVVEASIDVRDPEIGLSAFEWGTSFALRAPGWYRARWSDSGMTGARDNERYEASDPVVERCLLQLWPAPPAPDTILRETSSHATYWHGVARSATPPPTPVERAHAEEAARVARAQEEARWRRQEELERWGGGDPTPRLREVEEQAVPLTQAGRRDVVDALAGLAPAAQRRLALDLAREACAAADVPVDWTPALTALERETPLPAPFDDRRAAYAAVFSSRGSGSGSGGVVVRVAYQLHEDDDPPAREPLHPASAAVGAVFGAAEVDPLAAVLAAVEAVSWSAPDLDTYFAEVGRRAAALSGPSS